MKLIRLLTATAILMAAFAVPAFAGIDGAYLSVQTATPPPVNAEDSPAGYIITEDTLVFRVFNADTGKWITELWPARCTVFEDGSARCPSYFD